MSELKTLARLGSPEELEALRVSAVRSRDPDKPVLTICNGTGCQTHGGKKVTEACRRELAAQGLEAKVEIRPTGCLGFCERGPIVVIRPADVFYQKVAVEDVAEIVSETVVKGNVVPRLLYTDLQSGKKLTSLGDIPFYSKQQRLVFGANLDIDPYSIQDYVALGGYSALVKALFQMTPQEIIDRVKLSGLRGRGGGGFPTGVKWETCRRAAGEVKYVIANGDEGDPGAYANRSLIEGNPHSILEGMIIGAYAMGSHDGYVYVRNEYPLAVDIMRNAIKQAEDLGLLGENILGSGFGFSVRINRGGGAFVCGESTALMASLEGKVGEPRAKYVHTVERGLWDRPSDLNNVETWANVPLIINRGAEWFRRIGTEGSKGTKIFSLVGKVNNTGLVEVPMGITLREIVYDIGGGIKGGRKFKAIQTGGPSGGCLPESFIDRPVDFDELTRAGSMMGSGGMIVMDDRTCMVDVARYFLTFLEEESCGKCVPCREGIKRMRQILDDICSGKGKDEDVSLLQALGTHLKDSSLCALGQTAPNPVVTTIRYFGDEYQAHTRDKKCPAGVCKELIRYRIVEEKCPGCGLCVKACPAEAIAFHGKRKPVTIDEARCIKCGTCYDVCKLDAVGVT